MAMMTIDVKVVCDSCSAEGKATVAPGGAPGDVKGPSGWFKDADKSVARACSPDCAAKLGEMKNFIGFRAKLPA